MMRGWALLLPLWLMACSAAEPVRPPLTPQQEVCASAPDDDPAYKEQLAIAAGRLDWQFQNEPQIEQIKRDAITRCLRARGLAPRGGVEKAR